VKRASGRRGLVGRVVGRSKLTVNPPPSFHTVPSGHGRQLTASDHGLMGVLNTAGGGGGGVSVIAGS